MPDTEHLHVTTLWSTSAFGQTAAPSAGELAALGDHLAACRHGGRLAALHCGVYRLRGFVAAHLVTSASALTIAGAVVWLAL